MGYPDPACERAMTVQEVILKALEWRAALVPGSGHPGLVAAGPHATTGRRPGTLLVGVHLDSRLRRDCPMRFQ